MDNEAFQALVRERSQKSSSAQPSTKEIAREAVEREYREKRSRAGQRRKRGGNGGGSGDYSSDEEGGGGGSDDEYDDRRRGEGGGEGDGNDDDSEPRWKRLRREKRSKQQRDGSDPTVKYRDRAKERREGKNVDYVDTSVLGGGGGGGDGESEGVGAGLNVLLAGSGGGDVDARTRGEMSKFLGGDEAHTHLVKGLDVALAAKVRREEMGGVSSAGHSSRWGGEHGGNSEGASAAARKRATAPASSFAITALGKGVLSYLQSRRRLPPPSSTRIAPIAGAGVGGAAKGPTVAGRAVQRSTYAFAIPGCTDRSVGDKSKSWEIPRQSTVSQIEHDRTVGAEGGGRSSMATPLDRKFLERISAAFESVAVRRHDDGNKRHHKKKKKRSKDKWDGDDDRREASLVPGFDSAAEPANANGADEMLNSASRRKGRNGGSAQSGEIEEDSDEDIFGGAGEYVPPAAQAEEEPGRVTTTKMVGKGSIFSGLTAEEGTSGGAAPPQKRRQQQQEHRQQLGRASSKATAGKVIDRDIFGAKSGDKMDASTSRRGPMAAAAGVSVASYRGGYGEEMDADFDGRFADEDDSGGRGKTKSEDMTTAAAEYGASRGREERRSSSLPDDG